MFKKFIIIFAIITFIISVSLGIWIVNSNKFISETIVTKEITIDKGESFNTTYEKLVKDLDPPLFFKFYLNKVMHFGQKRKYGTYSVKNQPLIVLLNLIEQGKQINIKITFPEGYTVYDVAKTASKFENISEQDIIKLSKDKKFIKKLLGKDYPTLEGFLYPDTYLIPPNTSAETLLTMMVNNFKKMLPESFEQRVGILGLRYYEGIILASIIQKETYKDDEYPIIASVFYNRLRRNMRLQSDPTVIYGMKFFNGNLRKVDLHDASNPYNTYKHNGLPPTPICNPSRKALEAVVNPAITKYLYFVADKKGGHIFSKSYNEHRINVRRYQLNRR
jgi:UPF0755 protein